MRSTGRQKEETEQRVEWVEFGLTSHPTKIRSLQSLDNPWWRWWWWWWWWWWWRWWCSSSSSAPGTLSPIRFRVMWPPPMQVGARPVKRQPPSTNPISRQATGDHNTRLKVAPSSDATRHDGDWLPRRPSIIKWLLYNSGPASNHCTACTSVEGALKQQCLKDTVPKWKDDDERIL